MKKIYVISAALLVIAAACSQKEALVEEPQNTEEATQLSDEPEKVVYIKALGEVNTKASIDGNTGDFTWKTGDQIAVYAGGYKISSGMDGTYDGANDATFSFSGGEAFDDASRANFAIYPASLVYDSAHDLYTSDVAASSLKINLPASYELSKILDNKVPIPMIAANAAGGNLEFKNLGALVRFTLINVPKQTQYITFDFNGKKVQGEFTLTSVTPGTTAVQTSATDGNDDIITVHNDDVFTTFQKNLVVNIPVPAGVASTGEYTDVTVTTWDGEPGNGGHKINALTTPIKPSANWVPARKGARKRDVYLPVFATTVSNAVDAGTKVVFAPGNLRATLGAKPAANEPGFASSWSFAPHQYDAIGGTIPDGKTYSTNSIQSPTVGDVIDLFGWVGASASGYTDPYADDKYKYGILYPSGTQINNLTGTTNGESILLDWGHNVISDQDGDYPADTWRLLSSAEWYKVIRNRGCVFVRATLKDGDSPVAYGMILTPDQYTHPAGVTAFNNESAVGGACSDNVFTLDEWDKLEGAGCVFLPLTNLRTKATYTETVKPGDAWYWTNAAAASGGNGMACVFNDINVGGSQFSAGSNNFQNGKSVQRKLGCAFRLVRVVNDK